MSFIPLRSVKTIDPDHWALKKMKYKIIQSVIFPSLIIISCTGIFSCSYFRPRVLCEVPLQYLNEAPVIEVMINEQGPFRFIVDTGSNLPLCLVRSDLVEQLKLAVNTEAESVAIHSQLGQEPLVVPVFAPVTISIGQLSISNVSLVTHPSDSIMNHNLFKNRVAGLIGIGIFEDLVIAFDFIEQEFRIGSSPKIIGLVSNEKVKTIILPTRGNQSQRAGVQINAGGLDMPALLDTGSVFSLGLPMTYRKQLSIAAEESHGSSLTFGGEMLYISSKLNGDLIIGRHTISNPNVKFSDTGKLYANIGFEILKEFRVIGFDYANNQIYLGAVDAPTSSEITRLAGIDLSIKKTSPINCRTTTPLYGEQRPILKATFMSTESEL